MRHPMTDAPADHWECAVHNASDADVDALWGKSVHLSAALTTARDLASEIATIINRNGGQVTTDQVLTLHNVEE